MANDLTDQIGQHHFCAAQELYAEKGTRNQTLSEEHFLYRWWFPANSPIVAFIKKHLGKAYLEMLKHREIKLADSKSEQVYYALYFGKTTQGRTRFQQHMDGPVKKSTLRETIRAILAIHGKPHTEDDIRDVLLSCYYEWTELVDDQELMDCYEAIAIALGNYPLNIDGNHSVGTEWKEKILKKRTELKDY